MREARHFKKLCTVVAQRLNIYPPLATTLVSREPTVSVRRQRRGTPTDARNTHQSRLKFFKVPFHAFNSKTNTFQGDPILKRQAVF